MPAAARSASSVKYARVPRPTDSSRSAVLQALPAVGPQRLQARRSGCGQRRCATVTIDLSTSPVEQLERVVLAAPSLTAHAVRRIEVEPTGEHRQPREQRLLGLGEQPIGPVDRRGEALLPRRAHHAPRRSAAAACPSRRATSRLLITRIRAAASSIASGRPSSRRQISATAPTGS